jgi:exodeoxyribonuclease VII small subunit
VEHHTRCKRQSNTGRKCVEAGASDHHFIRRRRRHEHSGNNFDSNQATINIEESRKEMSKAKKPASATDDSVGYAEAVAELEAILEELESDDVDVDALAEHVQRASQLIELCRERIGKAKLRIEEVVTQLDND